MLRNFSLSYWAYPAALLLTLSASATDWPQFRGPTRDATSLETGLLKEWPAEGPALDWKATEVGGGYSGVAVVGGNVFLMGDGADAAYLYALDEKTGKERWRAKLSAETGGGDGFPGPRGTPSCVEGRVYALGQFGDLLCVNAADGKEIWRKNLAQDFGGVMMGRWGFSESPLIDEDRLICSPGGPQGTVLALNKTTGETLWRTTELPDKAAYSSPVATTIHGVKQYVVVTDQHVIGLQPADGKILWKFDRPGGTAVIPTPVVSGDLVYISSGYKIGCHLVQIHKEGDAWKAEALYAEPSMTNKIGGVVLLEGNIYGHFEGKGGWCCQELKTGNVLWTENKLGAGAITYADGRFYLRQEGGPGTIVLLEPSPTSWIEKGRFNPPDRSTQGAWQVPVIANGRLYIRDLNILLAYKVKGG